MSKKLLQITLAILGAIPILAGGLTVLQGVHALDIFGVSFSDSTAGNVILDSEMRFLSAIWMGIGMMVYAIIPTIEKQTLIFRLIMAAIILGGVGRTVSRVSRKSTLTICCPYCPGISWYAPTCVMAVASFSQSCNKG
jgi:hypothetical protein